MGWLVTTKARRIYIVSEPIIIQQLFLRKFFSKKTTRILMNKPIYLGISILEIIKK